MALRTRQVIFYLSILNIIAFLLVVISDGFHFRTSWMYGLLGMEVLYYGIPSLLMSRVGYLYYKHPEIFNEQCYLLKRRTIRMLLISIILLDFVALLEIFIMLSLLSKGQLWLHGLCYYGPILLTLGFVFGSEGTKGANMLIRAGCVLMLGVAHDILKDSYLRINDLRDYVAMIGSPILIFLITFLPDSPIAKRIDGQS
jgi:hypothetical protein